jgi:hypothetical protein
MHRSLDYAEDRVRAMLRGRSHPDLQAETMYRRRSLRSLRTVKVPAQHERVCPADSNAAHAAPRRRTSAFLGLFVLPSVAQSVLLTVVPLAALRLLGTALALTLVYIAAGLAAVVARLSIPLLVQLIRRRFVLSIGALLLMVGTLLLTSNDILAFACGLALNSFAFACIEITRAKTHLSYLRK